LHSKEAAMVAKVYTECCYQNQDQGQNYDCKEFKQYTGTMGVLVKAYNFIGVG